MIAPTMRLRGNVWVADLYDKAGNRFRTSTKVKGAEHEAQAREVAKGLQAALSEGERVVSKPRGPTLRKAWDECEMLHFRIKATRSLKTIGYHRAAVFDAIPETTLLSDLSLDHFKALIQRRKAEGNSDVTIGKVFQTLGRVLAFAVEHRMVAQVPKVPKFDKVHGRIRVYTEVEEAAMLKEFARIYPEMVDFTVFLIDTGLRLGELLTREHLNHDRAIPAVEVWLTKNDLGRIVPLTPRADEALARWLAHESLTKDAIQYRWQVMRRNIRMSGDKQAVIHALRHTCCTRLIRAGMDISKVQLWMGHLDIQSTLRYTHLDFADLREGVKLLQRVPTVPASVPETVTEV